MSVFTINLSLVISFLIVLLVILTIYLGIKIVPQSKVFVIERFGRYSRTLNAGLSIIVPYLDRVAHRVDILERQLDSQRISVITKDNVEVELDTSIFYRVVDASRSVYRISNIDNLLVYKGTRQQNLKLMKALKIIKGWSGNQKWSDGTIVDEHSIVDWIRFGEGVKLGINKDASMEKREYLYNKYILGFDLL